MEHSQRTWTGHEGPVHKVKWSPHEPAVFATASADRTAAIFDCRSATGLPVFRFTAHGHEVTALDWLKYTPWQLVTGSVDREINVWDVRFLATRGPGGMDAAPTMKPSSKLTGHSYAVKSLSACPHAGNLLLSTSYDMTWRLWDLASGRVAAEGEATEFITAGDFDLFDRGAFAVCSWDETIRILRTPL